MITEQKKIEGIIKKTAVLITAVFFIAGFAGCGNKKEPERQNEDAAGSISVPGAVETEETAVANAADSLESSDSDSEYEEKINALPDLPEIKVIDARVEESVVYGSFRYTDKYNYGNDPDLSVFINRMGKHGFDFNSEYKIKLAENYDSYVISYKDDGIREAAKILINYDKTSRRSDLSPKTRPFAS